MMTIRTKKFKELTTTELYDLIQLRSEVFVVEQMCVYQDLDGKDEKALHVIGKKDNKIVAYARVFEPGDYFENASIGRVVVRKEERQYKYGYAIMESAIRAVKDYYNKTEITLSAQSYLKKFYNNLGFKVAGEEYLEDGIPHIKMTKI